MMDNPKIYKDHSTGLCEVSVGVDSRGERVFVQGSSEAVTVVQILILENAWLRKAQPFNDLRPAQAERLALLVEEMGESIQAVGKVLRHGFESRHPDGGPTNRTELMRELGHVQHAVDRLCRIDDLNRLIIDKQAELKSENVAQYLHHN